MLPARVLLPLVLSVALCGAILPRDYEEVVVAGGYNDDDGYLSSVETMGGGVIPDLPFAVDANTLTLVGPVLYNCVNTSCYTLNTSSSDPQWLRTVSLPVSLRYHTAVAIGSHIWFLYNNFLYDLDTETNEFYTYQTLFEVDYKHCAVSDGEYHSFVLGVGDSNREIWMNSVKNSPARWEHVGDLSVGRRDFGCLWLSNYLVSTGGDGTEDNAELFDMNLREVEIIEDLNTGRYGHRMFVYNSKPAVVGGYYNDFLSSIETYDLKTDKWTTEEARLITERRHFSSAQFIETDP